jgi:hypothetical protein
MTDKVTIFYSPRSGETFSPTDIVRVRYRIPYDASGGEGWDTTASELLAELMTEATRAPQRNWWQIRNDDGSDMWTVIDHVATRQRAERGAVVEVTDLNRDELDELLRATNMRTWLEFEAARLGTPRQLEDYSKGRLGEGDLRRLARDHLFAPFRDLPRWAPMGWRDVTHKSIGCVGEVTFEVNDVGDSLMPSPEPRYRNSSCADHDMVIVCSCTQRGRKIGELSIEAGRHQWLLRSGEGFSVAIRNHVATCTACGAREVRLSALVRVEWASRTLSREFAL